MIRTKASAVIGPTPGWIISSRSEEHTSELQSRLHLVCRLLLEKKKTRHLTCCRICTFERFRHTRCDFPLCRLLMLCHLQNNSLQAIDLVNQLTQPFIVSYVPY